MKVKVMYFAAFKEAAGKDQEEVQVDEGASLSDIFKKVSEGRHGFNELSGVVLFSLNHEHADGDKKVKDGDEVGIFPPISGG